MHEGAVIQPLSRPDTLAGQLPCGSLAAGRICIVTGELAGPDFNGGIGTANRGLVLALQRAGYAVDVLYTRVENGQPFSFRGSFEEQVASFRAIGVNLMCIAHEGRWDDWLAKSLRVMEALLARSYDLAFFDDTHGTAYYTALAKRTGSPALARTRLVVVTHSATQWISELNQTPVSTFSEIRLLEIERRSIELADYVVSPSEYILRKYRSYGWTLPEQTIVRPNILPFSAERPVPRRRSAPVDELVFFGRLERRKGLWLFCEALDRLKYEIGSRKVTFLGKFTFEDGESTGFALLRRSVRWPFSPAFLYSYDREQALAYLKGGSRLAVMPSPEDNSPCAILECLVEGIPFLASSGSGGQELISKEDHDNCLFEPTVESLTAKLRTVLAGEAATAQPSFAPRDNVKETMRWVAGLLSGTRAERPAASASDAASGRPPLKRTLLLLAPEEMPPQLIGDMAQEFALIHPEASIVAFAEDISAFGTRAKRSTAAPGNLRFARTADFRETVSELARDRGMAVICRLDQPIPADVLARAEACFGSTGIDAITVMRGHRIETAKSEQPYVCAGAFRWEPEEYKTGDMQALLPLCQDTNSGLLVVRSEVLDAVAAASPQDQHRCRLKDMGLFVHEILLNLSSQGRKFELLPDCFLNAASTTASYETFDLPRLGLSHLGQTRGYAPGSETLLLSRLSIETFAGEAARRSSRDMLAGLLSRVGGGILDSGSYWPQATALATYAKIAHAAGRPGLAMTLLGRSLTTGNALPRDGNPTPTDMARQGAHTIELSELIGSGRYTGLNLNHSWSFRFEPEQQVIEIHPNGSHEGKAAVMFQGIVVPASASFIAEIELTATAKGPVKFEMEIELPSHEADALRFEWDLQPGGSKIVEFELPAAYHSGCDVMLVTSMLRRRDPTEGAHARWRRAAFRPR